MDHVVVIGAGHAGVQVADSLRGRGFGGEITLLGAEQELPYQRPPLSKDFLTNPRGSVPLPLRAPRFFTDNQINLRTGVRVTALRPARRVVVLDSGEEIPYSTLVLATGAAPRTLVVPGIGLAGVHELRTLADARRLRAALPAASSVVVIGAGFIGLEVAASAGKLGARVTVLEAAERPLARAVSPVMSTYLDTAHRRMGVEIRLGEGLAAVLGRSERVSAVVGTSGREYPADLVVLGVGVSARDELARAAGLPADDGVVVDERLRTADPAVFAIGDCARFPGMDATPSRLESVQNATDQGRHVANAITGDPRGYTAVPWFWSNQGPLRLQIAGRGQAGDATVVTGDVSAGRFSVCCFRHGRLVAVESLNRAADHLAARRVLARDVPVTPRDVADPTFNLKEHADRRAQPQGSPT